MTATGRVQLSIAANTVHNAAGQGNAASTGPTNWVFYDINPPTATLENPAAGAAVLVTTLNSQKYLDIAYSAQVGAGVNTPTITMAGPQFTLSGTAATGVKITSDGISLGGDVFQYTFSGSFGSGMVMVNFIPHSFEDNAGNWNKAASYSFTVTLPKLLPPKVATAALTPMTLTTPTTPTTPTVPSAPTNLATAGLSSLNATAADYVLSVFNFGGVAATVQNKAVVEGLVATPPSRTI
jgi:hypothetical protein